MIGAGSNIFAGYLPEAAARTVFGDPDQGNATMSAPSGKVVSNGGSPQLTGRRPFTSNCLDKHHQVSLDEAYVERIGLRTDLAILWRTAVVLTTPRRHRPPPVRRQPDPRRHGLSVHRLPRRRASGGGL